MLHNDSPAKRPYLSSGLTEHFDSLLPGTATQVIRRQESFRQERINFHCGMPGCPLISRPLLKRPGCCVITEWFVRALVQHLEIPGIVTVNVIKIPRARDNLRIALSRTWLCLHQKKGFHVDVSACEDFTLAMHRIRRNPHAALQITESTRTQIAA